MTEILITLAVPRGPILEQFMTAGKHRTESEDGIDITVEAPRFTKGFGEASALIDLAVNFGVGVASSLTVAAVLKLISDMNKPKEGEKSDSETENKTGVYIRVETFEVSADNPDAVNKLLSTYIEQKKSGSS